ncbi:hypothetical protein HC761_01515 [bacterium]|nr:hypothetical protein [bacterium]
MNNYDYYDSPLRIRGAYVHVDGFIFDLIDNNAIEQVGWIEGSYNRVTRSIFRRQGAVNAYGGWLYVGGHHHLVEDVGGVGAARYGFATGGPSDDSNHIIFRRVVGRFDFSSSAQPKATFNAYGHNDTLAVHHIWFQNCIALDGQRGPNAGEPHYAAFYFPKNLDAGWIDGSIALNNQSAYGGFFVQEQQGRNTILRDVIAWNNCAAGVRWNGSGATTLQRLTIGEQPFMLYNGNGGTPPQLRDSVFQVGSNTLFKANPCLVRLRITCFTQAPPALAHKYKVPPGLCATYRMRHEELACKTSVPL